jgi:hypothetical protein
VNVDGAAPAPTEEERRAASATSAGTADLGEAGQGAGELAGIIFSWPLVNSTWLAGGVSSGSVRLAAPVTGVTASASTCTRGRHRDHEAAARATKLHAAEHLERRYPAKTPIKMIAPTETTWAL